MELVHSISHSIYRVSHSIDLFMGQDSLGISIKITGDSSIHSPLPTCWPVSWCLHGALSGGSTDSPKNVENRLGAELLSECLRIFCWGNLVLVLTHIHNHILKTAARSTVCQWSALHACDFTSNNICFSFHLWWRSKSIFSDSFLWNTIRTVKKLWRSI